MAGRHDDPDLYRTARIAAAGALVALVCARGILDALGVGDFILSDTYAAIILGAACSLLLVNYRWRP